VAPVLVDLRAMPPEEIVGAKAARLGWATSRGWPVPAGVVIPFAEVEQLGGAGGRDAESRLRTALEALLEPGRRHAVRSSASTEDDGTRSFAGQFATLLDVAGADDVLAGVRQVVASALTPHVAAYARRVGADPTAIRMSVIVQQMVTPTASGVAFSRDPVDGADRVVVEVVAGRGDRLVGRGATPQRWDCAPGREPAQDGPSPDPVPPLLPHAVVCEIVDLVRAVADSSGEAVDVEWVWDGRQIWLVQWRPITTLTRDARVWSSRIARDVMPGLIPPLVWSVNVPVVNGVWVDLLDTALGRTGLDPERLARPFGYRAYFDMGAFGSVFTSLGLPADALEQMRAGTSQAVMRPSALAILRRGPRILAASAGLLRWPGRARLTVLDAEEARLREAAEEPRMLSDVALLARVDRLLEVFSTLARLNVVTPLLADAAAARVRRAATGRGLEATTIEPGQDLMRGRGLDPARALAAIDPRDDDAWSEYLDRFGHLSDSPNDCSRPTWAEQEDAVRRRLVAAREAEDAGSAGGAAWDRGREAERRAELLARTPHWQRPGTARAWSQAARLRLAREHVGFAYARFYGLFRPTFLEAGARLTSRGLLAGPEDVFLLTLAELRAALAGELPQAGELTAQRRQEMAEAAEVDWPETIVGDDPVPVLGRADARVLRGTPTSRGRHTGPARVVTSLANAPDIGPDDVLVLEAADVTWTPLLLHAGAVVTETGGMLSHASIVARELGLPCVVSVPGVLRVPEGARLSVDGGSGEVLVLDRPEVPDEGTAP